MRHLWVLVFLSGICGVVSACGIDSNCVRTATCPVDDDEETKDAGSTSKSVAEEALKPDAMAMKAISSSTSSEETSDKGSPEPTSPGDNATEPEPTAQQGPTDDASNTNAATTDSSENSADSGVPVGAETEPSGGNLLNPVDLGSKTQDAGVSENTGVAPACGNGALEDGEECDDGNSLDLDGCVDCRVTLGWQCDSVPSVCSQLPPPVINSFLSSDTTLPGGGGTVTLSWDVSDADLLVIENNVGDEIGKVTGEYVSVSLTQSTTYTLIATNASGETTLDLSVDVSAQGLQDWVKQLGTTGDDYAESVAVDGSGNVFIAGYTGGHLGGMNAGGSDAFVAKYAADGSQVWIAQLGTTENDDAEGVAVDASGNVFIAGTTGGALQGMNAGGSDAFVAKYTTGGTLLWKAQLGTSENDYTYSVAVDASGNVFLGGSTYGDLKAPNAGYGDTFVAKLTTNGTLLWTAQQGTDLSDSVNGVAVDASGNVFSVGYALFPSTGAVPYAVVSKYDAAGTLLWNNKQDDIYEAFGAVADANGNLYIAGYSSAGALAIKYSPEGMLLWNTQVSAANNSESGRGVAVDTSGNLFVAGETNGDLNAANVGQYDAFLAKYSEDGTVLLTAQLGTTEADYATGIAVDAGGNVFIVGRTKGDLDGVNAGGNDAFVARYR